MVNIDFQCQYIKKRNWLHSDSHRPISLTKDDLNESENEDENINNEPIETSRILEKKNDENDDDEFLEKFQQQQRKREKLETKSKISHRVFCPFYPEVIRRKKKQESFAKFFFKIKQEGWWLYVADRKNHSLITMPIYICTLKDHEEVNFEDNLRLKIQFYLDWTEI